jgi:hypothetical protein
VGAQAARVRCDVSAVLYAVAGLLVAVSCGLGLHAWRTRARDPAEGGDAGYFYRHPDAEEYQAVLAGRARSRAERERRADAVWATFAGPGAQTGALVSRRLPPRAEVEAWLAYTPSWQRETDITRVLPPPGGTRLVTRFGAAVERYRHGAGSLGELLAEMDLLAAQHIRAVNSPGTLALAEGVSA